jgi:hypothetical protein
MANIESHYTEQLTEQTSTSASYTDITGASIASGNFTTDDRYLILINAHVNGDSAGTVFGIQTLHGSTAFTHSQYELEPSSPAGYYTYTFFTVWTAVTGEGIKLQFKADGTNNVAADAITMLAMNLDDANANFTKGTEWDYAETDADTGLSTSWSSSNNASITMPGNTQSGDYLLLSSANCSMNSTSTSLQSGTATTNGGTPTAERTHRQEGEDTSELQYHTVAEVLESLSASATRYQESRNDSATKGTRLMSRIFYLYLDAFATQGATQTTAADLLAEQPSFTEHHTLAFTDGSPTEYWVVLGWMLMDPQAIQWSTCRLQIDGSSVPESNDTERQERAWDSTDQLQWSTIVRTNTSIDTSIDLDAGANAATTQYADEGVIVVFSTELPADGGQTVEKDLSDNFTFASNQLRDFWGDRLQADSFTPSDNLDPLRYLLRLQSDSSTFSDSPTYQRLLMRLLSNSATFSDQQLRDFYGDRTLQESIALTDSLVRSGWSDRLIQEIFSFGDQHAVDRWLVRLNQESIALAEQIARDGVFTRDLQDVFTFAEDLVESVTSAGGQLIQKTLSDIFVLADNMLVDRIMDRVQSDAFTFLDQTVRTGIFDRLQSDSILTVENFLTDTLIDRSLQESIVLAENLLWDEVLIRQVSDEFSLTDQIVRDLVVDRVLADTFTFVGNLVPSSAEADIVEFVHWRLYTYHKWALRRRLWRRFMDLDHYPPS